MDTQDQHLSSLDCPRSHHFQTRVITSFAGREQIKIQINKENYSRWLSHVLVVILCQINIFNHGFSQCCLMVTNKYLKSDNHDNFYCSPHLQYAPSNPMFFTWMFSFPVSHDISQYDPTAPASILDWASSLVSRWTYFELGTLLCNPHTDCTDATEGHW